MESDQAVNLAMSGAGNIYPQLPDVEKNTFMSILLDNSGFIEKLEETFKGRYLRDEGGNILYEQIRYKVGNRDVYAPGNPIIIGKPFIVDKSGNFCEEACNAILAHIREIFQNNTVLTNYQIDDIKNAHRFFARSFVKFMGLNCDKWELNRSVMQTVTSTVLINVHQIMMRSVNSLEYQHLGRMVRTQEKVIVTPEDGKEKNQPILVRG